MTAAANRDLLTRYMSEVWGERNPRAVERFASESFMRHTSPVGEPLDRTAQISRLESFRKAFPDITIEVDDVVSEGDLLAFRSVMRGTHRGEFLGIPPTGQRVSVRLVDMVRVESGRFVEQWGGPDMLDLVRQLGGRVET